ncbi:MAG: hypothetical protein GWN81_03465, partial [Phycisphaerae bacterium]|nr:hypothetical protein [Phycisphaerae bacterium]
MSATDKAKLDGIEEGATAAGADNLGDHTATQDLNMGSFDITANPAFGLGTFTVGTTTGDGTTLQALGGGVLSLQGSGDMFIQSPAPLTINSGALVANTVLNTEIRSTSTGADIILDVDGVEGDIILDQGLDSGSLKAQVRTPFIADATTPEGVVTWQVLTNEIEEAVTAVPGDNLGDHIATQDLDMSEFDIVTSDPVGTYS